MLFTERPKSGKARKLWDWFTAQSFDARGTVKAAGVPPKSLCVIRPGLRQREAGAAQYEIEWGHASFYIHDINETLTRTNATPVWSEGFFYL